MSGGQNPNENQSRNIQSESPQQNQSQKPNEYETDLKTVAIDHEAVRQLSASESVIEGRQWVQNSNRKKTYLHEDKMQTRFLRHDAIFRRPHCLQYFHPNDSSSLIPPERLNHPLSHESRSSSVSSGERDERSTDNFLKQLIRLDLFIDLVWVGIIANLSGTYGEQAFADSGVKIAVAILEFSLLFIPIWRVWDYLREYGSNFYKDDVLQRMFVIWILVLAVLYGINAPFAFVADDGKTSLQVLICIYLIIRASFLAAHLHQCIFMPFLRRLFLFQLVTTIIGSGLWIAAIWVRYPYKIALLVAANALEHPIALFMSSPLSDRLLSGGWERSTNIDHYVERVQGFFIIILGEGVFRLIEGSPSGIGLNPSTGTILLALLLYYMLHWLYFNGDQSKQFVHALRRTWYKPFLWKL
jgi:low temperature requirement protein LtrA